MHGHIEGDQRRIFKHGLLQFLYRQVQAFNRAALVDQPRGRLGQSKWLAADFVGIYQYNLHLSIYVYP